MLDQLEIVRVLSPRLRVISRVWSYSLESRCSSLTVVRRDSQVRLRVDGTFRKRMSVPGLVFVESKALIHDHTRDAVLNAALLEAFTKHLLASAGCPSCTDNPHLKVLPDQLYVCVPGGGNIPGRPLVGCGAMFDEAPLAALRAEAEKHAWNPVFVGLRPAWQRECLDVVASRGDMRACLDVPDLD